MGLYPRETNHIHARKNTSIIETRHSYVLDRFGKRRFRKCGILERTQCMYWVLQRVQAWAESKNNRKMKTEICFDCYRLMQKREEIMDEAHRVFWICESCGKRKYDDHDQLKMN